MKITLERLREIITEEVIKEELAPEIAAPAIAAMLQGTDSVATSDIFGAAFNEMHGPGSIEDERDRRDSAEDPEEEVEIDLIGFGQRGKKRTPNAGTSPIGINEEELSQERAIVVLRSHLGNMGYEVEKMLVALLRAGYSQADIIKMAIELKKMNLHPQDVQVAEEGLNKIIEEEILNILEND